MHSCKLILSLLEECPSGLRSTLGKRVYVNAYRGFESHLLHIFFTKKYGGQTWLEYRQNYTFNSINSHSCTTLQSGLLYRYHADCKVSSGTNLNSICFLKKNRKLLRLKKNESDITLTFVMNLFSMCF